MRIVYYDHGAPGRPQEGFRSGRAGFVSETREGELALEPRVEIGPNSLHALEQHGVVAHLNRLTLEVGPIAVGRDAVVAPTQLDEVARILTDADRQTYGNTWEFVVRECAGTEPVQYRIVIDNREYQRTLARLVFLATSASRAGRGIWLRL